MLLMYINIIVSQHNVAKDLGNNVIYEVIDIRLFCQPTTVHPHKWTIAVNIQEYTWTIQWTFWNMPGQYNEHSGIYLDNTVDILEYAWTIQRTFWNMPGQYNEHSGIYLDNTVNIVSFGKNGNFTQTLSNILQICLVSLIKWTHWN